MCALTSLLVWLRRKESACVGAMKRVCMCARREQFFCSCVCTEKNLIVCAGSAKHWDQLPPIVCMLKELMLILASLYHSNAPKIKDAGSTLIRKMVYEWDYAEVGAVCQCCRQRDLFQVCVGVRICRGWCRVSVSQAAQSFRGLCGSVPRTILVQSVHVVRLSRVCMCARHLTRSTSTAFEM